MEGKTPSKRARGARIRSVPLPPCLDIAHVGELKQLLTDAIAGSGPLRLDASAVEQVDGAGMQLLLAFRQAAQVCARNIEWQNPPARLRDAATLLGMNDALGLDARTESRSNQQGT